MNNYNISDSPQRSTRHTNPTPPRPTDPLRQLLLQATEQGLLTPIGASPIKMRASLYADNAALFVRPIAADIDNLQQILQNFGDAMGLCTNFQKYEIFPICCEGMDIPSILGNLQVKQGFRASI